MSKDININESAILETLNAKIDYDGGNFRNSGLANYVVDKAGDTLNKGAFLHLQNANATTYCGFVVTNHEADATQATISTQENYMIFNCKDKNGNYVGELLTKHMTNGSMATVIRAMGYSSGSKVTAELQLGVDSTGKAYFSFPRCTTKATTTSSASASNVAVVVQNYVSGTSWYRVWSDGWIEQGGTTTRSDTGEFTITFLKSFTNTNYTLMLSNSATSSGNAYAPQIRTKNKNNAVMYLTTGTTATNIVNWLICGY
jgi:hypothetical protein